MEQQKGAGSHQHPPVWSRTLVLTAGPCGHAAKAVPNSDGLAPQGELQPAATRSSRFRSHAGLTDTPPQPDCRSAIRGAQPPESAPRAVSRKLADRIFPKEKLKEQLGHGLLRSQSGAPITKSGSVCLSSYQDNA